VILIDTNLLIYAHVPESAHFDQASKWFEATVDSGASIGIPWHSVVGFLRIATSRRVFQDPPAITAAWSVVEGWFGLSNIWIPSPGSRHSEILGRLLRVSGMNPNLVHDAHLAAIAIENDLMLLSADADFARFGGLQWKNPLN